MSQDPTNVSLPDPVVAALEGWPEVARRESAHLLLTVLDSGFPHVCLLSRAELEPAGDHVLVVLAGRRSVANLDRDRRATLLVVADTTVYSVLLEAVHRVEHGGMVGFRARVSDCRADSLGIPLTPIGYVPPASLPSAERWEVTGEVLTRLRTGT